MNITEVRIRLVKSDEGKLKGVASITIEKTPTGEFKDIVHPLNTETREKLRGIVLAEFEKARSQAEAVK